MKAWTGLLTALLTLLLLTGCGADGRYGLTVITEGTHSIGSGEVLQGDLIVLGGHTIVQDGAQVTGAIFQLGGMLELAGAVAGNLAILGGVLQIGPQARVGGDLELGGGQVDRAPTAVISGQVTIGSVQLPTQVSRSRASLVDRLLWALLQGLALALLATGLTQYLPRHIARTGDTLVHHPLVAGAMGLLASIVGAVLLVLMAFTIVLIPVVLVGLLLGAGAVIFGWAAAGAALGRWLTCQRGWPRGPRAGAFLGTMLVAMAFEGARALPVIGGTVGLVVATIGLGAVVLTRFGAQAFVPAFLEDLEMVASN